MTRTRRPNYKSQNTLGNIERIGLETWIIPEPTPAFARAVADALRDADVGAYLDAPYNGPRRVSRAARRSATGSPEVGEPAERTYQGVPMAPIIQQKDTPQSPRGLPFTRKDGQPRKPRPKATKPCVGCGGDVDEYTAGCTNCGSRHAMRRYHARQRAELIARAA